MLLLFAAGALAFTGLCVLWLFSDETQNSPEGMAALAYTVLGLMALLTGVGLLLWALSALFHREVVKQEAWLEDPADRTLVRWWDGRAWTQDTAPRDPAVVALAPLTSSGRRRRRWGLVLLVGGVVAAVGAQWASDALFEPPTYLSPTDTGGLPQQSGSSNLWMVVGQVTPVAALVAVIGLYLVLTLADDPRAGWKPDPLDPSRVRWWDGRSWTDLSADPGAV